MAENGYCEWSGYNAIAKTILQFSGGFGQMSKAASVFSVSSVFLANLRNLPVKASQHYADLFEALLLMPVSGKGDDILCKIL